MSQRARPMIFPLKTLVSSSNHSDGNLSLGPEYSVLVAWRQKYLRMSFIVMNDTDIILFVCLVQENERLMVQAYGVFKVGP